MSEQVMKAEDVLFIGNLPYSILDTEFHQLAAEFGPVSSAIVVRDERERSRGFGFVRYSTKEAAEQAQQIFDGKEVEGRLVRASFARSDSRYLPLLQSEN